MYACCVCLLCALVVCLLRKIQRCAAAKMIRKNTSLISSMLADLFVVVVAVVLCVDAVAVVLSICMYLVSLFLPYLYWSHFFGMATNKIPVAKFRRGAYTRSFFRRKRAWVPLFFTIKKVPGNLEQIVKAR